MICCKKAESFDIRATLMPKMLHSLVSKSFKSQQSRPWMQPQGPAIKQDAIVAEEGFRALRRLGFHALADVAEICVYGHSIHSQNGRPADISAWTTAASTAHKIPWECWELLSSREKNSTVLGNTRRLPHVYEVHDNLSRPLPCQPHVSGSALDAQKSSLAESESPFCQPIKQQLETPLATYHVRSPSQVGLSFPPWSSTFGKGAHVFLDFVTQCLNSHSLGLKNLEEFFAALVRAHAGESKRRKKAEFKAIGPIVFFRLRDYKANTSFQPPDVFPCQKSNSLLTKALLCQLNAERFYRRLTVYCHQYLEPDSEGELVPAKVFHIRFNSAGSSFVTAGDDGLIKVWDASSAKLCYSVRRHFSDISDIDLRHDDIHMVSCCSGNDIRVWKLGQTQWEPLGVLTVPARPTFVRFFPKVSPASATPDLKDTMTLTRILDGMQDQALPLDSQSSGPSLSGSLCDPSNIVLNVCDDGFVRIYTVETAFKLQTVEQEWSFSAPSDHIFGGVMNSEDRALSDLNESSQAQDTTNTRSSSCQAASSENNSTLCIIDLSRFVARSFDMYRNAISYRTAENEKLSLMLNDGLTPSVDNVVQSSHGSPEEKIAFPDGVSLPSFGVCIALGLEVRSDVNVAATTVDEEIAGEGEVHHTHPCAYLAFCSVVTDGQPFCDNLKSIELRLKYNLACIKLPCSVPDVAFARFSPHVLTVADDRFALIWEFHRWEMSGPLNIPESVIALTTRIHEKLERGEYRINQHPMMKGSLQPSGSPLSGMTHTTGKLQSNAPTTSQLPAFKSRVTAMAWADSDRIVLLGTSVERATLRAENLEKNLTKDTEIAIFESSNGRRLFSILDHRCLKTNVSFIKTNPLITSLVVVGTFSGQILLLNLHLPNVFTFLDDLHISVSTIPPGHRIKVKNSLSDHSFCLQLSDFPPSLMPEESRAANKSKRLHVSPTTQFDPISRCFINLEALSSTNFYAHISEQSDNHSTYKNSKDDIFYHPIIKFLQFPGSTFLDAQWSPTGTHFIVTQKDGCFSIFTPNGCSSLGQVVRLNDAYSSTPVEQFFDNDFRVLQRVEGGRIFCPFTNLEPHKLVRGPLLDGKRSFVWEQGAVPLAHFRGRFTSSDEAFVSLSSEQLALCAENKANLIGSVQKENKKKLDSDGNVSTAILYSPPRVRRQRGLRSPLTQGRRRNEMLSSVRSLNFSRDRRFRTLFSAAMTEDESDSSYNGSEPEIFFGHASPSPVILSGSEESASSDNNVEHLGMREQHSRPSSSNNVSTESEASLSESSNASLPEGNNTWQSSASTQRRRFGRTRRALRSIAPQVANGIHQKYQRGTIRSAETKDVSLYWSFWASQTDYQGFLKLEAQRVPVHSDYATIHADFREKLLFSVYSNDEKELLEGIPLRRIQLIQCIDELLRNSLLLESFTFEERHYILESLAAAARAHRLDQRRLRRGDACLPTSLKLDFSASNEDSKDSGSQSNGNADYEDVLDQNQQGVSAIEESSSTTMQTRTRKNNLRQSDMSRERLKIKNVSRALSDIESGLACEEKTDTSSRSFFGQSLSPKRKRQSSDSSHSRRQRGVKRFKALFPASKDEDELSNNGASNKVATHIPIKKWIATILMRERGKGTKLHAYSYFSGFDVIGTLAQSDMTRHLSSRILHKDLQRLLAFQYLGYIRKSIWYKQLERLKISSMHENTSLLSQLRDASGRNVLESPADNCSDIFSKFPYNALEDAIVVTESQPRTNYRLLRSELKEVIDHQQVKNASFCVECHLCHEKGPILRCDSLHELFMGAEIQIIQSQTCRSEAANNSTSDGVDHLQQNGYEFKESELMAKIFTLAKNYRHQIDSQGFPSRSKQGTKKTSNRQEFTSTNGIFPRIGSFDLNVSDLTSIILNGLGTKDKLSLFSNDISHQMIGPFLVPISHHKEPFRKRLRSAHSDSLHERQNRTFASIGSTNIISEPDGVSYRPIWLHKTCFLVSFCINGDHIELPTSSHFIKECIRFSKMLCLHCNEVGASLFCLQCSSPYHYKCSQIKWKDSQLQLQRKLHASKVADVVHRRYFPNSLTWLTFTCFDSGCLNQLRPLQNLMTGQFFSSQIGVKCRDWLLIDKQISGKFVPQLGDFIRVFPQNLQNSENPDSLYYLNSIYLGAFPFDGVIVNLRYQFPGLQQLRSYCDSGTFHLGTTSRKGHQKPFHLLALISILILPPHPSFGLVVEIPYRPIDTCSDNEGDWYQTDQAAFVLLSEIQQGLKQLSHLKIGDECNVWLKNKYRHGVITTVNRMPFKEAIAPILLEYSTILNSLEVQKIEEMIEILINTGENYQQTSVIEEISRFVRESLDPLSTYFIWNQCHEDRNEVNQNLDAIFIWSKIMALYLNQNVRIGVKVKTESTPVTHEIRKRRRTRLSSFEEESPSELHYFSPWSIRTSSTTSATDLHNSPFVMSEQRRLNWSKSIDSIVQKIMASTLTEHDASEFGRFSIFIEPISNPGGCAPQWTSSYWSEIELPISLKLINDKVANKYYRSEISLLFDLQLLLENSKRFNGESDIITRIGRELIILIINTLNRLEGNGDLYDDNVEAHMKNKEPNTNLNQNEAYQVHQYTSELESYNTDESDYESDPAGSDSDKSSTHFIRNEKSCFRQRQNPKMKWETRSHTLR